MRVLESLVRVSSDWAAGTYWRDSGENFVDLNYNVLLEIRRSSLTDWSIKVLHHYYSNGTILDIRNRRLYHPTQYEVETEDGETTYVICGEDPVSATKIIYFDDIQHKVSTVLTSIRN